MQNNMYLAITYESSQKSKRYMKNDCLQMVIGLHISNIFVICSKLDKGFNQWQCTTWCCGINTLNMLSLKMHGTKTISHLERPPHIWVQENVKHKRTNKVLLLRRFAFLNRLKITKMKSKPSEAGLYWQLTK